MPTNNVVVRSYAWGLDLSGSLDGAGGIGGLLMLNSASSGPHFYAYDGNGSVAALIDTANGAASANYEYDAFGRQIRSTGVVAKENPFRFSSKRANDATDLMLYEYRLYSPSVGRWTSPDPGEDLVGPNVQEFVKNDPVNWYDYLGLKDRPN